MDQAKAVQEVKSKYDLEQTRIAWDKAMEFFSGPEGRDRLWNVGGVMVGAVVAAYASKSLFPLVAKGLNNYFFQPKVKSSLVRLCACALVRLCACALVRLCACALVRLCACALVRLCACRLVRL